MANIKLEGIVENASVVDIKEKTSGSYPQIRVGYGGNLSLQLRVQEDKTEEVKIPLVFSSPFEARLITSGLKGQRVGYSKKYVEYVDPPSTDFTLSVKSGLFEGIEYKTNDYIN